jgi:hypothetical protein
MRTALQSALDGKDVGALDAALSVAREVAQASASTSTTRLRKLIQSGVVRAKEMRVSICAILLEYVEAAIQSSTPSALRDARALLDNTCARVFRNVPVPKHVLHLRYRLQLQILVVKARRGPDFNALVCARAARRDDWKGLVDGTSQFSQHEMSGASVLEYSMCIFFFFYFLLLLTHPCNRISATLVVMQ